MNVTKLNCTACGAPISVPDNLDYINCASCGSFLGIERGEGYVALKVAEKLARAIEDSGKGTQDVVRENTVVTRTELQRLQISQEISGAQMQLANIQAEIRSLERLHGNAKAASQLKTLRFTEYQAMDRLRLLNTRYSAPTSEDLTAWSEFAQKEIGWIDSEINVLNQCNASQRTQIIHTLNSRKQELREKVYFLSMHELKGRLSSFKVKDLPLTDQAAATSLLALLAYDEKALRSSLGTDVGRAVHQEVLQRQTTLLQAWKKMEEERISGILSAPSYQPNHENIASLNEYLRCIDQDLAKLGNVSGNNIAQKFHNKLLEEQRRTRKHISFLEKQTERAAHRAAQANKPRGEGFFAVLLAGFAAIFVGIGVLFQSLFGGRSASVSSTAWPTGTPDNKTANEANAQNVSSTLSGKTDRKSVGSGCVLGFLLLVAITTVCAVILISVFPDTSDTGGAVVGGLFLSIAIGLSAGSWVFLHHAAPNTTIRGLGGIPTVTIGSGKPRTGLNNLRAVKGVVGIITLLILWSLFLALAGYTTTLDSSFTVLIVLIGFILGPVLAAIIAARTDFPKDQIV